MAETTPSVTQASAFSSKVASFVENIKSDWAGLSPLPAEGTVASSAHTVEAPASPTPAFEHIPPSPSSASSSVPSSPKAPAPGGLVLEEDLEDFFAEFTLEPSSSTVLETTTSSSAHSTHTPSAEDAEKKRAITAAKRAKLEARMDEWEQKIHDLGNELRAEVKATIERVRSEAVDSLSPSSSAGPDSIGAQIAAFEAQGLKAIKGTNAYAKRIVSGEHYSHSERINIFSSVTNKVETRYVEGASTLSDKIAVWWTSVRDEVVKTAEDAGVNVEDLATDAQADVGMDYAWLDDVKTSDWTVSVHHSIQCII
jgi:hypothetical protein